MTYDRYSPLIRALIISALAIAAWLVLGLIVWEISQ